MSKFIYIEEVTSTNDLARDMAENGAEHLTCVWANVQSKGRGRLGRVWQTYPDVSIASSFIIREDACEQLPLMVSVALSRAISFYTPCHIKWPNDILCSGDKVSGILVERFGFDNDVFYVVGIGVNVNEPHSMNADEMIGSTLQSHYGKEIDREKFLHTLGAELKRVFEQGWPVVREEYIRMCSTIGANVTWLRGEDKINGVVESIEADGSLVLCQNQKTPNEKVIVRSGEIIEQAQGGLACSKQAGTS